MGSLSGPRKPLQSEALSNDLAVSALPGREVARLEDLARQARGFIQAAKAQNSRRAYRSDWRHFES